MITKPRLMLLLALVIAGILSACSHAPGSTPQAVGQARPPEPIVTDSTIPDESAATPPAADCAELEALLGMTDDESADCFGGGLENWTADKATYIGRIYTVSLLNTPAKVYTNCNQENRIDCVSVWVADGSRQVTESEVQAWVHHLSVYAAGEPVPEESLSEGGSQNWSWDKGNTRITLRWLGDIVTIDMQPLVGELK